MSILTLTAYAKLKGISPRALDKRIKAGTITERALIRSNGKIVQINSVLADNDFARLADPVQSMVQKKGPRKKEEVPAQEAQPQPAPQEPTPQEQKPQSEFANASAPKNEVTTEVVNGQEVKVEKAYFNDDLDRYKKAKASTEELKARKIEFEILELEGKLVDVDEVKNVIAKLVVEVKDAILNVPSKAGPELLACNDLIELENKLLEYLNQALSGLSRVENAKLSK